MAELSPLARARQATLLRRYVASLPEKRARLQECWIQVQAASFDSDSMAQLRELAHRLAGSAGSYGFDSLGEAAAALDQAMDGEADAVEQRRLVGERTAELLKALAAAVKK